MADLPRGTVTFLFTDIEGSTALWEQDRRAMAGRSLATLLSSATAIEAHGGVRLQAGRGCLQAAFPTAPDAWRPRSPPSAPCWPRTGAGWPFRVRMALHAGGAEDARRRLPRARSTASPGSSRPAHGGQVLLQPAQHWPATPAGAGLRDLGEHRLRDLARPERVFQLLHPDLRPTSRRCGRSRPARTTCPPQPTPFLGREREVARSSTCLAGGGAAGDADRAGRHGQDAARAAGRGRAVDAFPTASGSSTWRR